jgi:hypothetical protein
MASGHTAADLLDVASSYVDYYAGSGSEQSGAQTKLDAGWLRRG